MKGNKWVTYQAQKRAEREGRDFETVLAEDTAVSKCPTCDAEVKVSNLEAHLDKHAKKKKLQWNSDPLIQQQKRRKKELKEAAGKQPVSIVRGGLPGLGKRK